MTCSTLLGRLRHLVDRFRRRRRVLRCPTTPHVHVSGPSSHTVITHGQHYTTSLGHRWLLSCSRTALSTSLRLGLRSSEGIGSERNARIAPRAAVAGRSQVPATECCTDAEARCAPDGAVDHQKPPCRPQVAAWAALRGTHHADSNQGPTSVPPSSFPTGSSSCSKGRALRVASYPRNSWGRPVEWWALGLSLGVSCRV